MPPKVPQKRQRDSSPPPSAKQQSSGKTPAAKRTKKEQNAATEASTRGRRSVEDNKAFLSGRDDESSDAGSESSDDQHDDLDFEDVMGQPTASIKLPKRQTKPGSRQQAKQSVSDEGEDSDSAMDWEDATKHPSGFNGEEPTVSGDLELTLDDLPTQSLGSAYGTKKGPTKIERAIRLSAHSIHVQCLLYHNLIRNGWTLDKEVHKALSSTIPTSITKEIERWRAACGEAKSADDVEDDGEKDKQKDKPAASKSRKGKKVEKNHRDWGNTAKEQARGGPSINQSDPTVKLLKALTAWWRKRFTITAPGLRKDGWKDAARLEKEIKAFREHEHDPEEHGENVASLKDFRKLAQKGEGSRDVGAQLFVALLRSLGLETRFVSSLQPLGFGFSKGEDALPAKSKPKKEGLASKTAKKKAQNVADNDVVAIEGPPPKRRKTVTPSKAQSKSKSKSRGDKDAPINLSDDSGLSDAPDSDNDSLIDITPPMPSTSVQKYDRDLEFPHYWAEVLSPTSQTWIPVDPIVLNTVAINEEAMAAFEPRGAKADKAKQVFAYVVAFNRDGTAKDVTVRYLKRHMFPGKTKGVRVPLEKCPVHNRRGKVIRYREYDWFAHVMSIYERPSSKRTVADDIEDQRELKPVKPEKKEKEGGDDTLQGLKSSAEFVLERHLRREEAIKAEAEPVRMFTVGKGDKATEEPVYRRSDIIVGKTVETWHKEGREINEGEQPVKYVPFRAVTTTRKRELEEAERASGEKQKQGLYEKAQTKWIIPPPLGPDHAIPKNAYGNMDVYVPSMVPKGAVHIPRKGTAKVCKQLQIDFAEACTGFEFGHRMAIPILTGVVVAQENEQIVIDAWRVQEAAKAEKERVKREKLALGKWKQFLNKLRIVKNLRERYGEDADKHFEDELSNLTGKKGKAGKQAQPKKEKKMKKKEIEKEEEDDDEEDIKAATDEESATNDFFGTGGGFLPEGMDVEEPTNNRKSGGGGGGFMLDGADDEPDEATTSPHSYPQTPVSLNSAQLHDADDEELSDPPSTDEDYPKKQKKLPAKVTKSLVSDGGKITPPDSNGDPMQHDSDEDTKDQVLKVQRSKRTPKAAATPASSRGTKRSAARKSAEAVRSHYFEADSEDE